MAYYSNQEIAFISMVWVREDRRGRGLARGLIQRVIRLTHKDIRLEVHVSNLTRRLYEGLGFRLEEQHDEMLVMRRRRRVAIMQPYLFPYPGYFQLADAADCSYFTTT